MKREMKKIQQISNTADKHRRSIRGRKVENQLKGRNQPNLRIQNNFSEFKKKKIWNYVI